MFLDEDKAECLGPNMSKYAELELKPRTEFDFEAHVAPTTLCGQAC